MLISDSVFKEIKDVDDLICRMNTVKNGTRIVEYDLESIKLRLESFKEYLKTQLPDFSATEILKFNENFERFRDIYTWRDVQDLLIILEYEERSTQKER